MRTGHSIPDLQDPTSSSAQNPLATMGWDGWDRHGTGGMPTLVAPSPLLRAPAVGSPQRNSLYIPHPSIPEAPMSIQHRPVLHRKRNQVPIKAETPSALTGVTPKLPQNLQSQIHNRT